MEKKQPILDGIDPEIMDRLVTRRDAIRKGASVSSFVAAGLALGSVPVALAALAKDVFGQAPSDILDALQFAFILENLENEFYKAVLGTSAVAAQNTAFAPVRALIPASAVAVFQQIQKHEQEHARYLREVAIPLFGGTAPTITANDFDFTGGNGAGNGPFAGATTNLDFLLLAAQAFEDTGVRAYKGQAGRFLIANNRNADIALEDALRIHSVEARHAARIRRIRRQRDQANTAVRFSGYVRDGGLPAAGPGTNITPAPPQAVLDALALIYAREENTMHTFFNDVTNLPITVDTATMPGVTVVGTGETQRLAATMSFDEPLTKDEVIAIVRNFIKDDASRGLP